MAPALPITPLFVTRSHDASAHTVRETPASYAIDDTPGARGSTVHAAIVEHDGTYVAECLEVAVVTEGRSLDETVANLREAIALHLGDGDAAVLGLSPAPRIVVSYELASAAS